MTAKGKSAGKRNAKPAAKLQARSKGPTKSAARGKAQSSRVGARKPSPRRDGAGHLNPKYARGLRALSLESHDDSGDRAFFKTPRSGDDLAEELGEEAVETMTSGEDQSEHLMSEEVEEERGGPFVRTRADDEFATGTDRSNPVDATREPFPRT